MHAVGIVIGVVLWTFIIMMLVRFVVDWVQVFARSWSPSGPVLVLLEAVYSVTDPPIKAVRRVVPTLRIGSLALDLGFILVLLAAYLLRYINNVTLLSA